MHDVPFEKQVQRSSEYLCGAAALQMVYRSFGTTVEQERIWDSIRAAEPSTTNTKERFVAKTHQLVRHAVEQDFDALAVRVRNPKRTLKIWTCDDSFRVIVNHRTRQEAATGHFTVFIGADDSGLVIHDPAEGPHQRLDWETLQDLWSPKAGGEITGRIAVIISPSHRKVKTTKDSHQCGTCGVPVPRSILCPRCKCSIPFRPVAGLGCLARRCPARCWEAVFCPCCDAKALER